MEPPAENLDLEDGEIESDGEENNIITNDEKKEDVIKPLEENLEDDRSEPQDIQYSKSGKRKKSKSHKADQKPKDKSKKSRKYGSSEDDYAGKIEKAIRKALNNKNDEEPCLENDVDDRRKHKKRKKHDSKDGLSKKRKRQDYDEVDESEMMCVRGASPVNRASPTEDYQEEDRDSYESDSSEGSRGNQQQRQQRNRQHQRERNKNKSERRRTAHPNQDPDGVCLYFMQGKCHKGDDCVYSHDAHPPRKMELCKFYLMDCCAKRDKCLYMHADFPCKYYHTGLPCIYKDECKFAHGKPLTENLKNILLKHIESAPKEILGDFPRLNREGALKMMQTTQSKLISQYNENNETQEKSIPSLFELNIPNPQCISDSFQINNDKSNKVSPKVRHSRWQNDNPNQNMNSSNLSHFGATNVLSIKNLTGVLTPRQISDLTKMGIENLDQLGQLTVLQLNSIGISLKQITDIQLNTMSIQKLGLINTNSEQCSSYLNPAIVSKDLDLRVPQVISVANNNSLNSSDLFGKDVDMRFHSAVKLPVSDDSYGGIIQKSDVGVNKDMIDIDQYTKDALKFVSKDKENIDVSNECYDNDKIAATETKDVDHRVIPFSEDAPSIQVIVDDNSKKECDTDIRFLPPEPLFKSPEKRNRRSTTDDDDDNNLLIDEKWYSSDEEKSTRKSTPMSSPLPQPLTSQQLPQAAVEPSTVLSKLGDLSKIDISEEVTKLLNTMKNNLQDNKIEITKNEPLSSPKSLDSRSRKVSDATSNVKKPRISIYECIDGEPTDGRRRTDVDLRQTDYKIPSFGDTDLRQGSSGDIDFRLGLPFKAIPNYTPASEIDGSINSHPPIPFKLIPIEIPRPDYTDIKNSTAKSQALVDPRLRKVFRLSIEEKNSDNEKSPKVVPAGPRIDPRRKPKESSDSGIQDQKSNSLDLQTVLQNSNWYKDLSSTQKIFVNQHLASATQVLKQYQQEKVPGKKFDLSIIQSNSVLCNIYANLGIAINENAEYYNVPKQKEALLKTPPNFSDTNSFGNLSLPPSSIDVNNMNIMNMSALNMAGVTSNNNNMNVNHIHGFNQPFSDPRNAPTPGLLGIAPNIPHNFNNFGPNNFGNNMPFGGGLGNEFNFGDNEQNFQRFPNRGGHRGRGGDRWNRGSNRGNKDRKNFSDRGNWKNNRH